MSDKKQRKRERAAARREACEARAQREKLYRARRKERLQEKEEAFEAGLERSKKLRKRYRSVEGVESGLLSVVEKKAKKLLKAGFREELQTLSKHSSSWLRPVEEWVPKGKSPKTIFRSLVEHLLVKYSMPQFMYSVFEGDWEGRGSTEGRRLFVSLGQGGSLHKLVKRGEFPAPLTKRMCHVFMQSKAKYGFLEALRRAQVLVHGGDARTATIVASTRQLTELHSQENEKFWDHVIQWVCNQPMLDHAQVGPIFDWVSHQRNQAQGFSMKGRTGTSVLRAMEEWHGELAKERKIRGHVYKPSGYAPAFYERKVKLQGGGHHMEKHAFIELLSSKELASEGRAQKHCVYSYSWSVQRGNVSIWSYRIDENRALTIEVRSQTRQIVQVRGAHNRPASTSEMVWVKRWASENDLTLSKWVAGR